MRRTRIATVVGMALVAALTLGSVAIATAAPAERDGEAPGFGVRIGEAVHDAGARMIDILADLTGLDVADIQDRRSDGESVADIAGSEGVSAEDVVDAAIDARGAILDEKVAEGVLDAEDRDAALERMTERLSERVSSDETGPFGPGNGRRAGAHGGGTCLATE